MKAFIVLFLLLVQAQLVHAYEPCGQDSREKAYYHLNWVEVGIYQVDSVFANVVGVICAGIERGKSEIAYLNYRDNLGVKVYSSMEELKASDIPYLRKDNFPSAARWLVRPDHPLTVKVNGVKKQGAKTVYDVSLKFLRNVRKSYYASDLRDLRVNVTLEANSDRYFVRYNTTEFDKISLSISPGLNISSVLLLKDDRQVVSINPFSLPRATRR